MQLYLRSSKTLLFLCNETRSLNIASLQLHYSSDAAAYLTHELAPRILLPITLKLQ